MKKLILIAVLAAFLLSVSASYSQTVTVTGWERKVYYSLVDRTWSLPQGSPKESYDRIFREVAGEYGLTYGEINDIADRVWEQDLTDYEWQIIDDLDAGLDALPSGHTKEESNRVYREVANKYGITLNVLDDMDMRAWGF
ncbi:hypothetical protein ACFL5C_00340 [Candidatus Omnitrophota bacterium]